MGMFFAGDSVHSGKGKRKGFDRYREVLEQDFVPFMLCGVVSLLFFVPFALGMMYAILSTSALVMLVTGIIGGLFIGPGLYGIYDLLFRSLRDAPGSWWHNYTTALTQNWKCALIPGMVFGLFLGVAIFAGMLLFWWAEVFPSMGTIVLYFLSLIISTMLFSIYWPQLVLFDQSNILRFKNCLLFCIRYFWRTFGVAVLQVTFWAAMALFLPWSVIVLPIIGIWFILFLANFLLYEKLDTAFHIQEEINLHFPEQAPCYDEEEE